MKKNLAYSVREVVRENTARRDCRAQVRRVELRLASRKPFLTRLSRKARLFWGLFPAQLVLASEWLPGRDAPECPASSPTCYIAPLRRGPENLVGLV